MIFNAYLIYGKKAMGNEKGKHTNQQHRYSNIMQASFALKVYMASTFHALLHAVNYQYIICYKRKHLKSTCHLENTSHGSTGIQNLFHCMNCQEEPAFSRGFKRIAISNNTQTFQCDSERAGCQQARTFRQYIQHSIPSRKILNVWQVTNTCLQCACHNQNATYALDEQ